MHKYSDDNRVAHPDVQSALLDATPDCVKILDLNGMLLAMSNAGCLALGVTKAQVKGTSWIALLPESVHAVATVAFAQALNGNAARFAGFSECSGKVTYWDNLLTPAADQAGRVSSIVCVSRDITEQTLLRRDLDRSLKREQLLSGEMLHRIKNLFSVVNAVVRMSDREARSTGGDGGLAKILTDKLGALARAYESVLGGPDMSNVDMKAFICSVLNPFGSQCSLIGPQQQVPQELCNTLALFLHELATNSVKHGSLSRPKGEVHVCWLTKKNFLNIDWREVGGPPVSTPTKHGFGTHMIDRLAKSTGGDIARDWHPAGLHVALKIPLGKA